MDYLTLEGQLFFFPSRLDTCTAFDTCYRRRANKERVACLAKAKPRAKLAISLIDVRWQCLTLAGLACLICSLCGFQRDNCIEMTRVRLILMCVLF